MPPLTLTALKDPWAGLGCSLRFGPTRLPLGLRQCAHPGSVRQQRRGLRLGSPPFRRDRQRQGNLGTWAPGGWGGREIPQSSLKVALGQLSPPGGIHTPQAHKPELSAKQPSEGKKPVVLQLLSRTPGNLAAGAQALTPTEQWNPLRQPHALLPALTYRTKAGQT